MISEKAKDNFCLFLYKMIKITETPRDGWQGLNQIIPVKQKAQYINTLFWAGFDAIEVGSFVSAKAVPQLADTTELIELIDVDNSDSSVMVLVAEEKGAEKAVKTEKVDCLSFPFSISETFLWKNLRTDIEDAKSTLFQLNNLCIKNNKELVAYITMAFGNPYGDIWNPDILINAVRFINQQGIKKISFTDIVGISEPKTISVIYKAVIQEFPEVEFGFHLHTTPETAQEKIRAAYNSGCNSFDTVLTGLGGCPFTGKELMGNLDTMELINYCEKNGISNKIKRYKLNESLMSLNEILKITH